MTKAATKCLVIGAWSLAASVLHGHQKQSLRRRGVACFAAIARQEHFGRPRIGLLPPSDFHERADDVAHHVVEETVGFDFNFNQVVIGRFAAADVDGEDRALGGFAFRAAGLEAGEIVQPDQRCAPCSSLRHPSAETNARRSAIGRHCAWGRLGGHSDIVCVWRRCER